MCLALVEQSADRGIVVRRLVHHKVGVEQRSDMALRCVENIHTQHQHLTLRTAYHVFRQDESLCDVSCVGLKVAQKYGGTMGRASIIVSTPLLVVCSSSLRMVR
jgi:hypothetical protein